MELRHVRYFIAVADNLNFSKAAQRLHISQPPLSRQIHQLEEELGVELLIRTRRRVQLTKAGRVFLDEARKLVVQAERTTNAAKRAQKEDAGVLRIGIGVGLGRAIGGVVVEHHNLFPALDIECKDVFSGYQNEALRSGEIDVGFLRPPVDPVNLNCEVVFEERFIVILPKSHPLARHESLKLSEIAREPLIVFDRERSSGLYDRILGLYSSRGLTPHIALTHVEAHEEAGAIALASGKGIFIGAGAVVKVTPAITRGQLALAYLDEPDARIEVFMAWRKHERSAAVLDFLDSMRRSFSRGDIERAAVAAPN